MAGSDWQRVVGIAERAQKCDEPPFPARPWIAPPAELVNATPMQPGEVRFASKGIRRKAGFVLFAALTRDEAEERRARARITLSRGDCPTRTCSLCITVPGGVRTIPSSPEIRTIFRAGVFCWRYTELAGACSKQDSVNP